MIEPIDGYCNIAACKAACMCTQTQEDRELKLRRQKNVDRLS